MSAAVPMNNLRRPSAPPPAAPVNAPALRVVERRGDIDLGLLAATLLLVTFGVVMVYSASAVFAEHTYHNPQYFLVKQAMFAVVGLAGMTAFARLDYRLLRKLTYPMLGVTVALLVAVVVGFGHAGGGAARWIRLGPIRLQPAEIAKVTLVLWLAHSLSKKNEKIRTFAVGFLPHLMMAGLLMGLCLKQPDFGSAVVLAMLTVSLLFVAGARTGYILGFVLASLPVVHQLVMGTGYRRRRWEAFLEPLRYRHSISYQLVESWMAYGAGGVTGVGLGDSRQKLLFLPEAHTDFISAIVGEELGFVGVSALLCMYVFIAWRGVRIAMRAADDYGTYVAFGITTLLSLQALINLGVAMGVLPTKGLTLPLVSYGGSSLAVDLAAIGILLSISRSGGSGPAPMSAGPAMGAKAP